MSGMMKSALIATLLLSGVSSALAASEADYKAALSVQYLFWGLGVIQILRYRRKGIRHLQSAHPGAVEAMKRGAFDFVQKPVSGPAELRLLSARALERRSLLDIRETSSAIAPQIGPLRLANESIRETALRAEPAPELVVAPAGACA